MFHLLTPPLPSCSSRRRGSRWRLIAWLWMLLPCALCAETVPGIAATAWQGSELAATTLAGSEQWFSSDSVLVRGAGAGAGGRYVWTEFAGDFDLSATLERLPDSGRCGLMVRTGKGANCRYEAIWVDAQGVVETGCRQIGSMQHTPGQDRVAKPLPITLRARRWGDEIALTVVDHGPATPPRIKDHATLRHLAARVQVGVFVASGNDTVLAEARFTQLKLGPLELAYRSSWLGNTQVGSFKAVQQQVESLAVEPATGRILLNAHSDEGDKWAAMYAVADGEQLSSVEKSKQHRRSGYGVAATPDAYFWTGSDDEAREYYIFRTDPVGYLRKIPGADAKGTLRLVSRTDHVRGLAVDAGRQELYAADTAAGMVRIYDLDLQPRRSFPARRPGALALAGSDLLWVVERGTPDSPAVVVQYTRAGAETGIRCTGLEDPQGIALAPDGRLWVAEAGRRSQFLIFDAQGRAAGSFGAEGGILSRHAKTMPGEVHPLKFNRPVGIGFDAEGNIIAACNPGAVRSTELRRLTPDGRQLWAQYALEYMDVVAPVPGSDGRELVSDCHAYRMNYEKTTGKEWSYAAYTIDRHAHPEDPRLLLKMTGAVRCVIGGQPILYTTTTMGDGFAAFRYRADSAIAIPTLLLRAQNKKDAGMPAAAPAAGDWAWCDGNGDGRMAAGEFQSLAALSVRYRIVDEIGAIWSVLKGKEGALLRNPCLGLDAQGAPRYDLAAPESIAPPAPFTQVGRIFYDAAQDILYLGGYTAAEPQEGREWKQFGRVVCAYPGWSRGGREASVRISLPYSAKTKEGHDSFSAQNLWVAGDYVFVGISATGEVIAYDRRSGQQCMLFTPGPEVGGRTGLIDLPYGLNAFQRADGEYIILVESNDQAKVIVYRWRPGPATNPAG